MFKTTPWLQKYTDCLYCIAVDDHLKHKSRCIREILRLMGILESFIRQMNSKIRIIFHKIFIKSDHLGNYNHKMTCQHFWRDLFGSFSQFLKPHLLSILLFIWKRLQTCIIINFSKIHSQWSLSKPNCLSLSDTQRGTNLSSISWWWRYFKQV